MDSSVSAFLHYQASGVGATKTLRHIGESCWWTIHPASKQRSEGEKVRVGDDLILVSVATERYLVDCILSKMNRHISIYFYIIIP